MSAPDNPPADDVFDRATGEALLGLVHAAAGAALSPRALRVLVVLVVFIARADPRTGTAWPGPALLAAEVGMDVASVRKALRELEAEGWVVRRGRGRGSEYEPVWTRATALSDEPEDLDGRWVASTTEIASAADELDRPSSLDITAEEISRFEAAVAESLKKRGSKA